MNPQRGHGWPTLFASIAPDPTSAILALSHLYFLRQSAFHRATMPLYLHYRNDHYKSGHAFPWSPPTLGPFYHHFPRQCVCRQATMLLCRLPENDDYRCKPVLLWSYPTLALSYRDSQRQYASHRVTMLPHLPHRNDRYRS